jgi:hypothetical protein
MREADSVLAWLLEPSEPSVRYRTLSELLDLPADHPDVISTRERIPSSMPVVQLFDWMHPQGFWLQTNPRTGKTMGDGVEYGSFATTHFCLAYLAELGLDRTHPKVSLAAERYLDLQKADGDWLKHFSCLYGYNIRTFVRLGYRRDARLRKSIQLLLTSPREDGGYLCDMHEKESRAGGKKSCIRGSCKALAAFAELGPAYWKDPSCMRLLDYFLGRGGIYKRHAPQETINWDVQTMIFPFHWRAGLLEILYSLSKMGHGDDRRLDRAWHLLHSKADPEGRFPLEWTAAQSAWKVGRRGTCNKWMTLYARLAFKEAARPSSLDVRNPTNGKNRRG